MSTVKAKKEMDILNVVIEISSGYMRGYGRSLVPALLSIIGICGVRIGWCYTVFRANSDFHILMTAYPLSWIVTAVSLMIAYWWMKHHSLKYFFAEMTVD